MGAVMTGVVLSGCMRRGNSVTAITLDAMKDLPTQSENSRLPEVPVLTAPLVSTIDIGPVGLRGSDSPWKPAPPKASASTPASLVPAPWAMAYPAIDTASTEAAAIPHASATGEPRFEHLGHWCLGAVLSVAVAAAFSHGQRRVKAHARGSPWCASPRKSINHALARHAATARFPEQIPTDTSMRQSSSLLFSVDFTPMLRLDADDRMELDTLPWNLPPAYFDEEAPIAIETVDSVPAVDNADAALSASSAPHRTPSVASLDAHRQARAQPSEEKHRQPQAGPESTTHSRMTNSMNKRIALDTAPQFWNTRYGLAASVPADNPIARSLELYGEWAEHEIGLLGSLVKEGHRVLELGGQYGAHALWLSRAVGESGKVHVADPCRIGFQRMCANIAINGLGNVYTHPFWLGRTKGQTALSSLPSFGRTDARDETVAVAAIDELGLEGLDLIKVNIPGALVDLLAGAIETIREHRPVIYARLGGIARVEQEIQALKDLGYRCWSHAPYFYNLDNYAGHGTNVFPGCVLENVVAAPVESRFELEARLEL